MKTIGIAIVCTNAYFILGIRFVKKFMKHYTGEYAIQFYLFTDTDPRPYATNLTNIKYIHTRHTHWQDGTNSKFSNILQLQNEDCDYMYYFDADTNVTHDFTEEWFLGDLVGGEHYNNSYKKPDGTPEGKPYDRNPNSRAYVPNNTTLPQMYYYGAFFGGKKDRVLEFCQTNYDNQLADRVIGYEPCWNDESYINRYFHFTPPTFVVPASKFAFGISDKGGLGETRQTTLDIEEYKKQVLKQPDSIFDFHNQRVRFETVRPTVIDASPTNSFDISTLPVVVLGNDSPRMQRVLSTFSGKRSFLNKAEFRRMLEDPTTCTPILVLQDCVAVQSTLTTVCSYPQDADCLYVGISRFSAAPGYGNYQEGVEYVSIKDTPSIVNITNMLSSHAYVILSVKWIQVLLDSFKLAEESHRSTDLVVASNMATHNVYALRYPIFYQDGAVGGQEGPTKVTFDSIRKV